MRRVSFALVLAILLSFGLANALIIRGEFEGTYEELGLWYVNINQDFDVVVYTEQNDDPSLARLGWSSPLAFYGTGSVTTLAGPGTFTSNPAFDDLWDMGHFTYTESWDGDLTTGTTTPQGFGPGDHHNYSGISMDGWYNTGAGELEAFRYTFNIAYDPGVSCNEPLGTFCVAQGDMDNGTYDWLFDPPVPVFDEVCFTVKKQCNANADFTNCPMADQGGPWHGVYTYDLDATDVEGDTPYTYAVIDDGGVDGTVGIDANGVVTFNPTCNDVGSHTMTFGVHDAVHPGDFNLCEINYTITNQGPTIGGDCGGFAVIGTGSSKSIDFDATDPNTGDVLVFSDGGVVVLSGTDPFDGTIDVNANTGEVTINTVSEGEYVLTIVVTDCDGLTDECTYQFLVVGVLPFDIAIEKEHQVLQGHHVYIDVMKIEGTELMHGFDFLIGYDASALTFIGAFDGVLFDIPGMYEWEYFTYRYNWNGNCGNGCPSGLLRVVGMAETNNGIHKALSMDVANGTVLFTLDFLVTNDRTFECMFVPVYFYWMDCGDNTIAYQEKSDFYAGGHTILTAMSNDIYFYNGDMSADPPGYYEYHDMYYGFPGMLGAAFWCFEGEEGKPPPTHFINFFNGGVDIICADSIDTRGDVNLNGIANEIADAVTFTNYFIYGLAAFTINVEGQIAATEINGDGIALSVADLVYLIRIIVGDALPLPKVNPNIELNVAAGSIVSIDAEIGAAHFVFAGNANVSLADGASGMEIKSHFNGTRTNVLVYSFERGVTASGNILVTDGELIQAEAADYYGNAYKVELLPSDFSLEQNYPNPFNARTVIELNLPVASDYSVGIYNVAGQRVAEWSGFSEAGTVTINWDASAHASGIYFYKAEAGKFSATKKMVYLK